MLIGMPAANEEDLVKDNVTNDRDLVDLSVHAAIHIVALFVWLAVDLKALGSSSLWRSVWCYFQFWLNVQAMILLGMPATNEEDVVKDNVMDDRDLVDLSIHDVTHLDC
ncbi:hypothetical protein L1987_38828 [Smallanthus sonchifolius]|uniref:Uncharacterized protein n=1 Tax=Smallanthus sonchifolius TaxID=185202 RepID=A0ACB9HJQ9_9ASTR|nr:hypothetical protein L1987_38828 [Smallanthus sonchifolius]